MFIYFTSDDLNGKHKRSLDSASDASVNVCEPLSKYAGNYVDMFSYIIAKSSLPLRLNGAAK
jgi:hypothetical protein